MQAFLSSVVLVIVITCQIVFAIRSNEVESSSSDSAVHDGLSKRTSYSAYTYQYRNRAHQCPKPGAPKNGLTWYNSRTVGSIVVHSCKPGFALDGPRLRTCQANGKWSKQLPKCVGVDCGDPGEPDNSVRVLSSTTLNSIVKYKCKQGFRMAGSTYRVCQANGKWTGVPVQCIGTSCSSLSNPVNGAVNVPSREIGSVATYSCDTGFNLVGAETRVCRAGGSWSGVAPTCQAIDCGSLLNPQNGRVTFTSTTYRSSAVYACNNGFTLVGSTSRQCQLDGKWSRQAPICRVLSCGRLDSPSNGKVVLSGTTPGSQATYSCNDGFRLRGNVHRTCQNNGQWDGRVPSCSAVICEPLVAPLNGFVSFSSGTSSPHRPGDKATYSCREGFKLSGGDRVRVCQQDMTYTGSAPSCLAITCGPLRDPANGRVNVGSGSVGSQAVYTCNRGFELVGNARRTCQSSGTYDGSEPRCRPVDCGRLPAPANGRIVITTTLFGGAAKYFCNSGFELTGSQIRRCSANGQWSNSAPTCRSLGCGELQSPGNGRVQLTGTTVGSLATYSCNDGFLLVGDRRRTCQRSLHWSGSMPSCQRISCEVLQPPQFGSVSVSGSTPGARATYTCNRGSRLVGQRVRICQDDGSYSSQPPICQLISCEQLVSPLNGQVSVSGDNRPGSVATYSCNQGFDLEGSSVRTCGSDGSYSGQAPMCREIGCRELSNPANGRVQFASLLVSSVATYSCNDGYNLVGVSQRICQPSGEWSGNEPRCDIVDCGILPEPLFGTVDFSSTTFLSKSTYLCNDGFQLSEFVTRVCQANGQWSGSAPTCQPIACERLNNPADGFVVVRGNTIGAIATYSCNPGFERIGQETRECQSDGRYNGQAPRCRAVNCDILQSPRNGFVTFQSTSVGSTASYTCNQGFTITGFVVRVCQPNGEWSGQEPVCSGIDCGPLVAPDNGFVNVPSTSFGSVASYQCNSGFILIGERTRTCETSRQWSGSDPVCQAEACDPLEPPNNGFVRFSGTGVGSVASYSCNPGFQLQGAESRICRSGGVWSDVAPVCTAISCGPLNSPAQGSIVISGTSTNAIATYSCDTGFNLIGKSTRVCTSTGVWSGVAPSCQASDCGSLDNPLNGIVDISGTSFGDTATYRCNIGYQVVGEPVRTCEDTGLWSGTVPYCAPVDCGILDTPKNSRISITGTIVNSIATYSCFPGYELVGISETRLCSSNGQWAGEAPFCKPTECESLLSPINGHVSFTDLVVYSVATYECDRGFGIKGAVTRMCQKDGTWSGSQPTCEPSDCGPLFSQVNGMVDTSGTQYGDIATYVCMPGYTLVGEATRTCDISGVWTGVEPICQAVDCGDLLSPSGGRVTFSSTTFQSIATYTCNFGFQMVGERTRVCQVDGSWSGDAPLCQRIMCSNLLSPNNGRLELSNGNLVGSIASYYCFSGFVLEGNQQRTCQPNMIWTGSDPVCRSQSCGPLDDPINGDVSFNSLTIGSVASYSCNSGFLLVGATTRQCLEQGIWSNNEPICEAILCPILDDPQFGSVSVNGNTIGSIARYSCNTDFVLSDSTPRRCLSDGSWSGTAPICRAIDCGPLAQPPNGAVRVSGTRFGESARYSCTFGFTLQGGIDIRVCQIDGTWSGDVPVCVESQCPVLLNPTNGRVLLPGTRTIGSVATYDCNEGFQLVGFSTRICQDNEEWNGIAPTCAATSCGQLFDPVNGLVEFSSTTAGSIATYTCNPGFRLVGNDRRTCQNNRVWSGQEPRCQKIVIECPRLLPPAKGDVGLSGIVPGSTASYTCLTGYIIVGADSRFCQGDGTWTGSDPTCRSVDCPLLIEPQFGSIRFIGSGFGAIVRYSCDDGYELIGDSSRTCKSDGLWSGSDPICIPDATPTHASSCGDPGTPANSRKIGDSYNIGDVVYYECIRGYTQSSGDSSLTCNIDGRWVGTLPTCIKREEECFGNGRVFDSCGRACRCENGKRVDCCRFRRDFASYNDEDKQAYIDAVLRLSTDPTFSSRYYALLNDYKASFDTDAYSSNYKKGQFFIWNRYFLLEYENLLQEIDCRITIPFYDWTVLPLDPYRSDVWDDEYGFGRTSSDSDYCVLTGPFNREDYSLIPSAGSGCLKREYKRQKFPTRSLIERDVLTQPASNFNQFYRYLQLYVHTSVRCFVGGTMCTKDAANDPVFILHLAMIDQIYERWQRSSEDRLLMRYSSDDSSLVLAPNYAVRDFHNNNNLPGNAAVCYNEPNQKTHLPHGLAGFASFDPARNAMGCLSIENLNDVDHHRLTKDEKEYIRSKCIQ